MRKPFSLSAHRALSARKPLPDLPLDPPQGDRPAAWFHATSDVRASALWDLAERLRAQRPDIEVLITYDQRQLTGPRAVPPGDGITECPIDNDHPNWACAFLKTWRPAVCLWAGGPVLPNLVAAAHGAGVPLLLCDVQETDLGRDTRTWLPDPQRAAIRLFDRVFALDVPTFKRLKKLGMPPRALQIAPPLRDGLAPPFCPEEDLTEVGEGLAGRPVWYAAGLRASEAAVLLNAHRHAVRLAHRLLLVISPSPDWPQDTLTSLLEGAGLRYCEWEPGNPIDEFTQVLIANDPDSPALWFRLAPISILGGTLSAEEEPGFHPFIAAALGSAVLHGPHTGIHEACYERLGSVGGAQLVRGARQMAETVLRLSQPEVAAHMAVAGWDVVTEGAWLIDHLLELVQDKYDKSETSHETA